MITVLRVNYCNVLDCVYVTNEIENSGIVKIFVLKVTIHSMLTALGNV